MIAGAQSSSIEASEATLVEWEGYSTYVLSQQGGCLSTQVTFRWNGAQS